ncbi:Fic family protein [Leucobacter salsicius]|uniref:Fic family protein n=1 Tax=Leucobacter salsicius TaxID=664638 RepID=UPI000349BF96|nr:Fic family protein [Leucobacter salsicius]
MPLRQPSPDFPALREEVLHEVGERLLPLLFSSQIDDSAYLHWDKLSRKTPPEGLSSEEWWFLVKMKRANQARPLPLLDKEGTPLTVNLTDEVLQLSEEIARRSGGIVGGGKNDLNRADTDLYLVRSLLDESIRSSQLEGASTSRRVAVEMIDSGRTPRDVSEIMILNNYLAMQEAKEAASGPLSQEFVLGLHETLTTNTLENPDHSGRIQTEDDERISVWAGDVCVHVPPPAAQLPERLETLVQFANGATDSSPYLPPVVRAIITHFMFGYDHYFEDGNGRLARTAFYWSMLHNGYWLAEFATISGILREAPGKYGDAYQHAEDDDGDLTYFVLHQLRVFKRSLDNLDEHIARKQAENAQLKRTLATLAEQFSFRQSQILESFNDGEYSTVTASAVARRFHVTEQTARNDLKHLEELKLLARLPKTRPAIWVAGGELTQRLQAITRR